MHAAAGSTDRGARRRTRGLVMGAGLLAAALGAGVTGAVASAATGHVVRHDGEHGGISGTVTTAPSALGASGSFTISRDGTSVTVDYTVGATGATTFFERGVTAPTAANVLVGDRVVVSGPVTTSSGTTSVAATSIWIIAPEGRELEGLVGTVNTSGGSFTLERGSQQFTVDVSTTTTYRERGVTNASFANIQSGDRVHVRGSFATGTNNTVVFNAAAVAIEPVPLVSFVGTVGTITTTSGTTSFTLVTGEHEPVTVEMAATVSPFDAPSVTPPTTTVATGDTVVVVGSRGDGALVPHHHGEVISAADVVILAVAPTTP